MLGNYFLSEIAIFFQQRLHYKFDKNISRLKPQPKHNFISLSALEFSFIENLRENVSLCWCERGFSFSLC